MTEMHVIGDIIGASEVHDFENSALSVKVSITEQRFDDAGKIALSAVSNKTMNSVSAVVQV